MAVTMAEITKLRHLTSAGLMDCKKALAETNGDIEAAVEILRKKGQAVAAKREDRVAAEGCVLAKNEGNFAAVVALQCETDFVAKNAGFVELTQKLLDLAVANRCKSLDELKAVTVDGRTVADLVVEEGGKTGEKTELGAYEYIEAPSTTSYNHLGNKLATIVGFNIEGVDYQVGRDVAMQVASMNPVAVDRNSVAQSVIDSEAHIESNLSKGWFTQEDADKVRAIIKETSEAKAANLPEQMIQNIAQGRLNKFFKENCLMEQEFIKDGNLTIGKYLEESAKGLAVVAFKRVNLNED